MNWSSFSTFKLFLHSPASIKTIFIEFLEVQCKISYFSYIKLVLKNRLYKRQDSLLRRLLTPTDMSLSRTKEYSLPQLTVNYFLKTSTKTSKSCLIFLQLASLFILQRQTTIGFSFKNIDSKRLNPLLKQLSNSYKMLGPKRSIPSTRVKQFLQKMSKNP